MKQITVKIDGMSCGMCENHVNDTIHQKFNVKKVTSSHSKGETVILTEDDISADALTAALEPTGYKMVDYKAEPYEKKGLFSRFHK